MELMVLDQALRPLGVLDGYEKCVWTRGYYTAGSFSLDTDGWFFPLLRQGAYLYRPDVGETALLESLDYRQDPRGQRLVTAAGPMLEGLLGRWVIRRQTDLSGTPEEICRQLVERCCITDPGRELPGLELGPLLGGGEPASAQYQGENLLEQTQRLLKEQGLSQRLTLDFAAGTISYQVWRGKDRTAGQSALPPAVFSAQWENLLSDRYQWDRREARNVAYVLGAQKREYNAQGETVYLPAPVAEVDLSQAGEERREMWVNAGSVRWEREDDPESVYTQGEYQALLEQAGREALAQSQPVQAVKCAVDPGANQRYRKDWDLGDMVTYVNQPAGVSLDRRVTQVAEIFDSREESLGVTFGEEYQLSLPQVIRKEVKRV